MIAEIVLVHHHCAGGGGGGQIIHPVPGEKNAYDLRFDSDVGQSINVVGDVTQER